MPRDKERARFVEAMMLWAAAAPKGERRNFIQKSATNGKACAYIQLPPNVDGVVSADEDDVNERGGRQLRHCYTLEAVTEFMYRRVRDRAVRDKTVAEYAIKSADATIGYVDLIFRVAEDRKKKAGHER